MNTKPLQQTTNMMTANVSDDVSFIGESDFGIVKDPDFFYLRARMQLSKDEWCYITLSLPADISNDGSEIKLEFKSSLEPGMESARGTYERFSQSSGYQHVSISGALSMRYDWKTARMHGTFNFTGQIGGAIVEVTEGKFDMTGITDGVNQTEPPAGTGTFKATGGLGDFNADTVSIRRLESELFSYWEVVGRVTNPFDISHYAIFINKGVTDLKHELTKDTSDAWVIYFKPGNDFYRAINGALTFTSLPGTGHAKGTLIGNFQMDEETPVLVNAEFDIKEDLS